MKIVSYDRPTPPPPSVTIQLDKEELYRIIWSLAQRLDKFGPGMDPLTDDLHTALRPALKALDQ